MCVCIQKKAHPDINLSPSSLSFSLQQHHHLSSLHFQYIVLSSFPQHSLSNSLLHQSSTKMHFSTLAALAAFTSFTLAAEASTETTDTVAATQDLQRFYGTWITNKATGTFVDLYLGDSCKAGGTPVVGWCDGPSVSSPCHLPFPHCTGIS